MKCQSRIVDEVLQGHMKKKIEMKIEKISWCFGVFFGGGGKFFLKILLKQY